MVLKRIQNLRQAKQKKERKHLYVNQKDYVRAKAFS
jgi:hypothetical protein